MIGGKDLHMVNIEVPDDSRVMGLYGSTNGEYIDTLGFIMTTAPAVNLEDDLEDLPFFGKTFLVSIVVFSLILVIVFVFILLYIKYASKSINNNENLCNVSIDPSRSIVKVSVDIHCEEKETEVNTQ